MWYTSIFLFTIVQYSCSQLAADLNMLTLSNPFLILISKFGYRNNILRKSKFGVRLTLPLLPDALMYILYINLELLIEATQ